jgi:hypothetical protein
MTSVESLRRPGGVRDSGANAGTANMLPGPPRRALGAYMRDAPPGFRCVDCAAVHNFDMAHGPQMGCTVVFFSSGKCHGVLKTPLVSKVF